MKTTGRCQWRRSDGFIVKFEHIFTPCSSVSIVNFEQAIAGWEIIKPVKDFFKK